MKFQTLHEGYNEIGSFKFIIYLDNSLSVENNEFIIKIIS